MPKGVYVRSEGTLKKIRLAAKLGREAQVRKKGYCGLRNLTAEMKENLSRLAKGRTGEKNPNWRGGIMRMGEKAYKRLWKTSGKNIEKVRMYTRNRHAWEKGAEGKHSLEEWENLIAAFENKCACCRRGDVKLTVDHVIPISRGGSNNIENIQPLCLHCNVWKKTKTIRYFLNRSYDINPSSA